MSVRTHTRAHAHTHAHVGGRGTEEASMCLCLHWPVCVSVVLSAGERWRGCIWVRLGLSMCLWVSLGAGSQLLSYVPPSTCMNVCISVWAYLILCAHIYIRIESMMLCRFYVCVGCHCLPSLKRV